MSPSGAPKGRGPAPGAEMPWAAVPAEVAELVRPGLPGVVEDIIAAVQLRWSSTTNRSRVSSVG
jgi:hypothetical protein